MGGQFFRARQRIAHQTRNTLSPHPIEALEMIGFVSVLRDGLVAFRWNHPSVVILLIRVDYGFFLMHQWNLYPYLLGPVATPITAMKGHDLTRLRVRGDPEPRPVGLLLGNTPHGIGLRFASLPHHSGWMTGDADVGVGGEAATRATIRCKSHVRLTPTARHISRRERRSRSWCSL